MKTILIGSAAAVGLLASTAMAEPVKLGSAQLTDVTAGLLDGFNVAFVNNLNFGDYKSFTVPGEGDGGGDDFTIPTMGGFGSGGAPNVGSTLLRQFAVGHVDVEVNEGPPT
jgi:hypothetical protein